MNSRNGKILRDLQKGIQYHNEVLEIMGNAAQEAANFDPLHLTFTSFLTRKGINLMAYMKPFFVLLNKGYEKKKRNKERPLKRRRLDSHIEETSRSKTNTFFDWLPAEIMIYILSFLSIHDLFQVAKTCHAMNNYAR